MSQSACQNIFIRWQTKKIGEKAPHDLEVRAVGEVLGRGVGEVRAAREGHARELRAAAQEPWLLDSNILRVQGEGTVIFQANNLLTPFCHPFFSSNITKRCKHF